MNVEILLMELAKIVILAMLLERALVIIFDYRWFQKYLNNKGLKVPIALGVAWYICRTYNVDIISVLFESSGTEPVQKTSMGIFLTAMVTAGGSAAAELGADIDEPVAVRS